ncbi:hypothetical protein SLH46_01950 [Draconibacterium sp. IB214405]|uniref:hypothetical protein n=1 Tax=Draconibacterium sp. IB214405 TaxID=3097352 RepID=UPI002A0D7ABF|nr:hypothetical protein [Draconibacterium sp. IB214405]MDX8337926.1 hypothetical protein [Draconibacterium sp. IB214405]
MNLKTLVTAILVFSNLVIFGQGREDLKYSITIDAFGGVSSMKLNMQIERDSEQVKIYYKKQVDVDPKYMEEQEKIRRIFNKRRQATSERKKDRLLSKLKKIRGKYEIYMDDSIIIDPSENAEYFSLIDSVYKTDKTELLRDRRSGQYITIDGTSFHIQVLEENSTVKDLYVRSPREKSHPLINQLICDTLDLYRAQYANSILNKDLCNGY